MLLMLMLCSKYYIAFLVEPSIDIGNRSRTQEVLHFEDMSLLLQDYSQAICLPMLVYPSHRRLPVSQ